MIVDNKRYDRISNILTGVKIQLKGNGNINFYRLIWKKL